MVPVSLKRLTISVIHVIILSYGGLRYDVEYMIPIVICVIEVELYEREETNLLVFILQLNNHKSNQPSFCGQQLVGWLLLDV